MRDTNTIGIDLAKRTFQVCVVDKHDRAMSNRALGREALKTFLTRQAPALVVMETCGALRSQKIKSPSPSPPGS